MIVNEQIGNKQTNVVLLKKAWLPEEVHWESSVEHIYQECGTWEMHLRKSIADVTTAYIANHWQRGYDFK